jgi:hypothetical protein
VRLDPTAARSRRAKQRLAWWLTLPLTPLIKAVRRFLIFASNKAYSEYLLPGERIIALDAEIGSAGKFWLASNEAIYIVPMLRKSTKSWGERPKWHASHMHQSSTFKRPTTGSSASAS